MRSARAGAAVPGRPNRGGAAWLWAGLAAALAAGPARADFFTQSPGPLAAAHEKLEGAGQCQACHTDGRGLSNARCLGCHAEVARRIEGGRGVHGGERALGKECYLCHTDHKGRGRDILGFAAVGAPERSHFDHALAGFALRERHAGLPCQSCHKTRSFLTLKPACESCHRSPHGELRPSLKACERCHDAASWRMIDRPRFDHDDPGDARFATAGKHEGVPCARCHAGQQFRGPGRFAAPDCAPCHGSPHGDSLFGRTRCALCHSAKTPWATIRFEHAKETRFPLDGAHAGKRCSSCHLPKALQRPERTCASCHKDPHAGRFNELGRDCGACHTAARFVGELRFDHRGRTRFPLTGKHAEVDCRACHRGRTPTDFERFDAPTVGCMGCHQHADVHKHKFRDDECLRCHAAPGRNKFTAKANARFHGPGTRFPLTEGHARVPCEKCHQGDVYESAPLTCGTTCHPDDLHRGSLGGECLRCHEGGHWAASRFDHDDTAWPLTGHHQDTRCDSCHPGRRFKPTPRRCASCHGQDDAHGGTLGERCESCHSPTGRSLFDHNDPRAPDRFRLDGKHAALRCKACHDSTRFAATPTACVACHPEPAVHRGQLGTACATCHDASSWTSIHTGHLAAGFRFGGAHDRQACATCHPGGRLRRGTAELCIECHRGDDIHHNSLGPRCGDCHGQQTFAPARFEHARVGCELRGIHRTLPCNDCHVGGHFALLAPTCGACHRADAAKGASDPRAPPGHAGFAECAACHNVNFFAPSRAGGSESVCR